MRVDTSQLRVGDVVLEHGMRVRLDRLRIYGKEYGNTLDVYRFSGTVLNMAEVRDQRHVPLSFLREDGREDVWAVQGNELALWHVERNTEVTPRQDV